MYTYMIAQIAYVSGGLADLLPVSGMREVARAFMDANALGAAVFARRPTVMPRFRDHQRLSLRVIQRVDPPLNCCPSLHIAYSILLDNIAESVIAPHRAHRELFESIRYSTVRMFNSVLYTKQHALIDVGFGILCARIVFERRFAARFGRAFNDFTASFAALRREHPEIAYDRIEAIYAEARELLGRVGSFAGAAEAYLDAHGYPQVPVDFDVDACWFDTERREVVRRP
jgi:hypothetical protein